MQESQTDTGCMTGEAFLSSVRRAEWMDAPSSVWQLEFLPHDEPVVK